MVRGRSSVADPKASSFGDKADRSLREHRQEGDRRFLRRDDEAWFGLMVLGTSELPKRWLENRF